MYRPGANGRHRTAREPFKRIDIWAAMDSRFLTSDRSPPVCRPKAKSMAR